MFFITSLIAIALILYFLHERKYREHNKILSKIPSPPAWPIFGHTKHFVFKQNYEIFETLVKFYNTQPSVWRFHAPFISAIFVDDLKIIEEILSNTKYNEKSSDYNFLIPWIGTGLLISSGQKWHQRRKIITPAFHFKILEQFVDVIEKHGDIFVQQLRKLEGREVDVFPMISLYALDVICEAAMGYQLDSQKVGEQEYASAVKELTNILFYFMFDFSLRIKFLPKTLQMVKRRDELIKIIKTFSLFVINERKKAHVESLVDEFGRKPKLAFLDLLLQTKIDGKPLNDEDIREEVDTFMFEGHDTTTSAIAFTLYNLAKYPEIQLQVYEECRDVLGYKKSLTMQDLNKLGYLENVIKETLRLFPPVPTVSRNFSKPETIEGVTFPANTVIKISPLFLGRNPKYFPDPLKFDPSRFDDKKTVKLFSFIPFSAGSRNCIGQKFAMLELKSVLFKILRNFEIHVSKENENIVIAPALVIRTVNGINLSFKQRIIENNNNF